MKTFNKFILAGGTIAAVGLLVSQSPLQDKFAFDYPAIKLNNGTTTVAQTKTNEELAATVIGLYGQDQIKQAGWSNTRTALKKGLILNKKRQPQQVISYHLMLPHTTLKTAPYYQLSGPDHNNVIYYDGSKQTIIQQVPLQQVVRYTNQHYSNQQQRYFATRLMIRYRQ